MRTCSRVAALAAPGLALLTFALSPTFAFAEGASAPPLSDVAHYVMSSFLWGGALVAVEITVSSMTLGVVLGFGLALMRQSRLAPVRSLAWFYTWFVRGTPQLLQLVFIFDVLPVVGLKFDAITTAVIGFALNEAAFSAELIRAGLSAVSPSQRAAASALGMGPVLTLRRIILPQAMKTILPGLGNDTISMLKLTSIASVIFVNELTYRSQQIVGQSFKFFTVFAATAVIYLVMTSGISVAQLAVERKFDLERDRIAAGTGVSARLLALAGVWRKKSFASPVTQVTLLEGAGAPAPAGQPDSYWQGKVSDGGGVKGEPYVVCRRVWKSFGAQKVLLGVDMTIARGEVVVVLGPSGSGKSTLLRLVNHLETLDDGEIMVGGAHIGYDRLPGGGLKPNRGVTKARADAHIGMVFQSFNLFAHMTALENVMEAPIRV